MQISNYTLGIDMGVASIGWAVVSTEEKFIDSGVRIFPAGLDNFNSSKEKHPNQDRRISRGARRRIRRCAERKKLVCSILQELNWMPTDENLLENWYNLDVYELRHKAIDEKISLPELGRIILHLNQRRGFLSLRKTEESNADKETQGMLGEISALQDDIDKSGHRTLGNHLYHLHQADQHVTPKGKIAKVTKLRSKHTRRSMFHHEFDLIWDAQTKYHTGLTDKLRYGSTGKIKNPTKVVTPTPRNKNESLLEQFGVENITFFQRRVYWPESSIGVCELEPEERRAPIADRRFQEFRMLQEVNNLRILDESAQGKPEERKLTDEEREETIKYLTGKKIVKLDALKKHLCKKILSLPEPAQVSFNLEGGGRTTISATPTDSTIATKSAYGAEWKKLDEDIQNTIVEALTLPAAIDEDIREALIKITKLPVDKHDSLLSVNLPTSYGHLSIKALEELLPHMRKGILYMAKDESDSALHAAGYKRRDEGEHKVLDLLPSFNSLLDATSPHYDPHQVEINNPVVRRALTELRKVINGLIRKYGKPSRIHVEMARNLKMSPKQRTDYQKKTRQHEKERSEAREAIESHNIIANHTSIELYRLWKEQNELCIYSGKTIGVHELFSGEIDIDHIFPFSKSADNSYMNKVVCLRKSNADKGNKIPFIWLAHTDPQHYEEVIQRAKSLPRGKYKKFLAEEIPEGFVNRDLNDTAWMAKAARQYLARIVDEPHQIIGTKGQHTSTLRNQWELHSLLRNDDLDIKNRDDHRHHALDAIVIALCDQSKIQQITKKLSFDLSSKDAKESGKKIYRLKLRGDQLKLPWQKFRLDVADSINSIWVSHRPKRKISGALHKETNYGKTADGKLVVRKPIQNLSKKEIEGIIDPEIHRIVKRFIGENGGDYATVKTISNEEPLTMHSGIPIRKIRTAIPYAHLTIREGTEHETHVQSGSTHHLAIFSLGDGKYHFEPITLYEASKRLRAKEEVVQKTYPDMPDHAEYLFHLCSGDSMMAAIDGKDELFVFNTMATSTLQVLFAYHTDGTQAHKDPVTGTSLRKSCKPSTFEKNFPNARKVNILPTGEIRSMS